MQEGYVSGITDDGGFICSEKVGGGKSTLPFRHKDIENKSSFHAVTEGSKVHFQVKKRVGRCFAEKIYLVSVPKTLVGLRKYNSFI